MKTIKQYHSKKFYHALFRESNGKLYWRVAKAYHTKIGAEAGRPDRKGYFRVCIDGKEFRRSRIIYIMHFGEIPKGLLIDHKNENKSDDRIKNLRLSTNVQNKNNTTITAVNTSGTKGVSWKSANRKWQAAICVLGKVIYLGVFEKFEDAKNAYRVAAKKHQGEFVKGI